MQTIYVNGYIHGDLTEVQKDEVIDSLYSMHREYLYDDETGEFSADVWILESGQKLDPFHKPPILIRSYDEKLDDEDREKIRQEFQDFVSDSQSGDCEIGPVNAKEIRDLTPEELEAFIHYGSEGRSELERLGFLDKKEDSK